MQRALRKVFLEVYGINAAIINGDTLSSTSHVKNA